MNYEPFTQVRLDQMIRLWNLEIGNEFPMRKELFIQNSYEDVNVLKAGSCLAIDAAGGLIGFIIAKKYMESIGNLNPEIGWIQALLVKTDDRHKGIGTALLKRAEDALVKSGVKKILLGKDVWHYFPGIPDHYQNVKNWFMARGYRFGGTEYDLLLETSVREIPKVEGVYFSLLKTPIDKEALVHFLQRCFPGRWEYEAIKYFERGGSGREFVILKKAERIIGFCRINDPQSKQIAQNVYWSPLFSDGLGGMGPLGIDPDERGKGYGLAIVQAGTAILSQRGLKHIVIDWTQWVDFYRKVGAHPWKAYATYSKNVNQA